MKCHGLTRSFLLLVGGCFFTLPSSLAAARQTPAGLPPSSQAAVSATLGKDQPAYHARQQGTAFTFANPRHAFAATLNREGLTLKQSGNTVTLQLSGIGYGSPSQRVRKTVPLAWANRVEYRRGQLVEWYVNGPLGLEQGVTLGAPPGPRTGGHLTLAFAIAGALTPRVEAMKTAATFLSRTGEPRLRYAGLTVTDAKGATLPAWLKGDGQRLLIQVDDAGARYPLTIDPFIQTELITTDGTRFTSFGPAVAVSGDGNTVVVGAQNAFFGCLNFGAAFIFTQAGGVWTQQAKLTASDAVDAEALGDAVAISTDGNTVVVGAPAQHIGANSQQGAAYVFVKPAAGWVNTTQTAKLTASDGLPFDLLGNAVGVSGDTVVAAALGADVGANQDQGAIYVYVKPLTGWVNATQTAKLLASDGAAGDIMGRFVGISGNTVVAGAERADIRFAGDDQGAAYIFTGAGSVWTQQAKLTSSDGGFNDLFGSSVAISVDTVVVGAVTANVGANSHQGSAYIFTRAGGVWTQQAKLTASDGAAFDSFGHSVGISADSNTVVVGAPRADIVVKGGFNADQGAAYAFVKPLGGWVNMTETGKLVAFNGVGGASFGSASAASTATLAVVASNAGEAYVFTGGVNPPPPSPAALSSVAVNPTSVTGGASSQGTITLTSAAPAGGFSVALASNNAAASVPANVIVPQGATTAGFTVTTTPVTASTTVRISATAGGVTQRASLTVTPSAPSPAALSSVAVNPASVTGGASSQGTITLTSAAPAGGFSVALASNNAAASVPANVIVPQGATTAGFTVTTTAVTASTTVTISATGGGVTKTAALTVTPASPPPTGTATLTVTATGRTGETVSSSPAGINVAVGSSGSASFATGTSITLSATNTRDVIWSGACSSGGNKTKTCTFTLTANAAVTANVQ